MDDLFLEVVVLELLDAVAIDLLFKGQLAHLLLVVVQQLVVVRVLVLLVL